MINAQLIIGYFIKFSFSRHAIMTTMFWLLIVVTLLLIGFAGGGLLGAPWVPTRKIDVETVLEAASLQPNQLFIELGCGDGRLVVAAAKRGAKAIGYEINPLLWLVATLRTLRYYPRARIRLANFWSISLADADVVMAFLMPKFIPRLAAKTAHELKPGSRLISYIFKVNGRKPVKSSDHWFIYKY